MFKYSIALSPIILVVFICAVSGLEPDLLPLMDCYIFCNYIWSPFDTITRAINFNRCMEACNQICN